MAPTEVDVEVGGWAESPSRGAKQRQAGDDSPHRGHAQSLLTPPPVVSCDDLQPLH